MGWDGAVWIVNTPAVVASTPLSLVRNAQDDFLLTIPQSMPHSPTHPCAKSKNSKAGNGIYLLQLMLPQKNLMLHMVRQSSGQRGLCSPERTTLHWTGLGWRRGVHTCHNSTSNYSRIHLYLLLSVLLIWFLNTSNMLYFHLCFLKVSLITCGSWEIVINNLTDWL